MAQFRTTASDYERYGLDDPRCGYRRPTGSLLLTIDGHGWEIAGERHRWKFTSPPFVQRLYDRYHLTFSRPKYAGRGWTPLTLLVPLDALTRAERGVLETLREKRHPENAPGDFYGVASECLCFGACVPVDVAPGLVRYQEEPEGCYFFKQPQTPEEIAVASEAVLSGFVDNLRYGGCDVEVLAHLRAGTRNLDYDFCQGDVCDYPSAPNRRDSPDRG